ncbi:MAG: 6-bladed beta-propeller [Gemmatimonadaceae bacterium]|nr:6-bladed beta-propeller [Gemmatimonadaceae bacterium]MCW5825651.1 6-bladed beta-propeller [Gemmatimonadaceae bacterium]
MRTLTLVTACLLLTACAKDRDGTDAPTWTLRETLRIGEGDVGPTSFSWVKGIEEGADGRIYIYEHSTQDIRVFDRSGAHVKTIGRKGRGPGELENAEGIVFSSDGLLWVRDAANSRFTIFDADGNYKDSWAMQYCWSQGTWAPHVTPERIVDYDCEPGVGGAYRVVGYRADRSGVDSLAMRAECGTREQSEAAMWITRTDRSISYRQIPWAPRPAHTIDGTGATWCAPSTANYELLRLGAAGDTVRVALEAPPLPVSAAERDSVIREIESRGPTGLDFSRIPKAKPAILRLSVDDRNRLWVRRDKAEGGILFDIITSDGRHEATVSLDGVRTSTWAPFVVRGDVVLLVIVGEDDVPQVGRFVIDRGR